MEYKTSGWKLSFDKKRLTFTDGFAAGTFKLVGSYDLHFYAPEEIKRVRVVHRADGCYVQFCVNVKRNIVRVVARRLKSRYRFGIILVVAELY